MLRVEKEHLSDAVYYIFIFSECHRVLGVYRLILCPEISAVTEPSDNQLGSRHGKYVKIGKYM